MTSTNKNSNANTAKRSSVSAMSLGEAMQKCQQIFSQAMRQDKLDEAIIWKHYGEQLEIIAIVLGVKKI